MSSTRPGEWLDYTIDVPQNGSYTVQMSAENWYAGGIAHFDVDGANVTGALAIPASGNFQDYHDVNATVPLTAGLHVLKLAFDSAANDGNAGGVDWLRFTPNFTVTAERSYSGVPAAPGEIIQAEDFDEGGSGVAWSDVDGNNDGGQYRNTGVDLWSKAQSTGIALGSAQVGEWSKYTFYAPSAGVYRLDLSAVNWYSGGVLHVESNGTNLTGPLSVPASGNWDDYRTIGREVWLDAGMNVLKLQFDAAASDGYAGNVDWLRLTPTSSPSRGYDGTVIGTAGSYQSQGMIRDRVFDGRFSTFFDAPAGNSQAWVGLDLGAAKPLAQIKYAPREGSGDRMVGGVFQASNTSDFSSGVTTLYTIAATPRDDEWSTCSVTGTYRYVRYLSPDGGYGNIAEMQVHGPGTADRTQSLTATIRDFRAYSSPASGTQGVLGHPDFERIYATGHRTGLLQPNLGADGTPVFASATGSGADEAITSAASFASWYHDDASYNRSLDRQLTLTETSPGSGVYQFSDPVYFPIDGQLLAAAPYNEPALLGHDSAMHNFLFTVQAHSRFVYHAGQQFDFAADDDMWVYINGKLAVDLGGTREVISKPLYLDQLGLTDGKTYDFDLFYADRHTGAAALTFATNVVLEPQAPVTPSNHAPLFTSDPYLKPDGQAYAVDGGTGKSLEIVAAAGNTLRYPMTGIDPDGDDISFSRVGFPTSQTAYPDGLRIVNGVLSWSPTAADVGTHSVRLRVTDSHGLFDPANDQTVSIRVIVDPPNRAPAFTTDPVVFAYAGQPYAYHFGGFDADGDTLRYEYVPASDVTKRPGGNFSVDTSSADRVTWTPVASQIGKSYTVHLRLGDQRSPELTDDQTYQITVLADPTNHPPSIVSDAITDAIVAQVYRYKIEAIDPDGDPLTYAFGDGYVTRGDMHLEQVGTDHFVVWTPTPADTTATVPVSLVVSDGRGGTDRQSYSITVRPAGAGTISGAKWKDADGDGVRDAGEGYLSGVQVYLDFNNNGDLDPGEPVRVTAKDDPGTPADETGQYAFTNLPAGSYIVREVVPAGYVQTYPIDRPKSTTVVPIRAADFVPGAQRDITFDEFQDGTVITDQYEGLGYGVKFGGYFTGQHLATGNEVPNGANPDGVAVGTPASPITIDPQSPATFITEDGANDTTPVLSGSPTYNGPIAFLFDKPQVSFGIDAGFFDDSQSTAIIAYGENGQVLGRDVNDGIGIEFLGFASADGRTPLIKAVLFTVVGDEPAGFAIDNLRFGVDSIPALNGGHLVILAQGQTVGGVDFGNRHDPSLPEQDLAIVSKPATTAVAGQRYRYDVRSYSATNLPVTYSLSLAPAEMVIDPTSGSIRWMPLAEQTGVTAIVVRVRDSNGRTATQSFNVRTSGANTAPSFTSRPTPLAAIGHAWSYTAAASDPDGDSLIYTADILPPGATFDRTTRTLHWTPIAGGLGHFRVIVSDNRGGTAFQDFAVLATADNTPPAISSTPEGPIFVGTPWTYALRATDAEDGASPTAGLRFSIDSDAVRLGVSVDPVTGQLTWTPSATGTFSFGVTVTDSGSLSETQRLTLPVERANKPNRPPTITSSPGGVAVVGHEWAYLVTATDPDSDPITLTVVQALDADGNPVALNVTYPAAGQMLIRWTPTAGAKGPIAFAASAVDDSAEGETQSFTLPILADRPPVVVRAVAEAYGRVGAAATYDLDVVDADGDPLDFSLLTTASGSGVLSVAHVANASTDPDHPTHFTLTYTPGVSGDQDVSIRVTDAAGASAVHVMRLHAIGSASHAPTGSLRAPTSVEVGTSFSPKVDAIDPDGQPLDYELVFAGDELADDLGLAFTSGAPSPAGMSIDQGSGQLSWTPTAAQVTPANGLPYEYAIVVTDSDGDELVLGPAKLSVVAQVGNAAPNITTDPQGRFATAIAPLVYDPFAVDANNDPLTWSLVRGPATAKIDAATGHFVWTPGDDEFGTVQTARIRVTDPAGGFDVQDVELRADRAAAITSTPTAPAYAGKPWQYLVQASDPDGDVVALSVVKAVDANGNALTLDVTHPAAGQMLIRWTPAGGVNAPASFVVRAVDPDGLGVTQAFTLPVVLNSPPVIIRAVAQAYARTGVAATYDLDVIDVNGDALSVSLLPTALGSGAFSTTQIAAASTDPDHPSHLTLIFTPVVAGAQDVSVKITDAAGASVVHTMRLTVVDGASGVPTGTLKARTVISASDTFTAQVDASDPDNDALQYELILPGDSRATSLGLSFTAGAPVPSGMTIDAQSGLIGWRPGLAGITPAGGAAYEYAVLVSDGHGHQITLGPAKLTVVARLSNQPPTITSDPTGIRATGDAPLNYDAVAIDPDNDPIVWSLASGPATASIDARTGRFTWKPSADELARSQVARIQVTDPYGGVAYQDIQLQAAVSNVPVNAPPRITSTPTQPGAGGQTWTYVVRGYDPDGDRITFALADYDGTPGDGTANLTITPIDAGSARITWSNPPANATRDFLVVVTDAKGATGQQRIALTIGSQGTTGNVDTPPSITSEPAYSVMGGQTYLYTIVANDPDGQVTYGLSAWTYDPVATDGRGAAATWLSVDPISGLVTGDTTNVVPGNYLLRISASQGGASAFQTFIVTVVNPAAANTPPVIDAPPSPLTAVGGQAFSYQVIARDADNDALAYSLVDGQNNLRSSTGGFRIDTNGKVTWTVPAGTTSGSFKVRAVDPSGAYAERTFSVGVGSDQPPSVSLTASTTTANAGDTVGFTVRATDDVGIKDVRLTLTVPWSNQAINVPVSSNGYATYLLPSNAGGQTFTAVATVVDTAGATASSTTVTIAIANPDTSAPVVSVIGVDDGITIDTDLTLRGKAYDPDGNLVYYSLTATPAGGGSATTVFQVGVQGGSTTIAGIGSSTQAGTLGHINPLLIANGTYQFTMTASDATGKTVSTSFIGTVKTASKVGDFSLTFDDLTASVGNVPISITRTYDSQTASANGDFGYGWKMSTNKGKLDVDIAGNDPLLGNLGWKKAYQSGTRITVTLPDGRTRGFTTVLIPDTDGWSGSGSILGLANLYLVAFMPDVDSRDTSLQIETGQTHPLNVNPSSGLPLDLGLPQSLTENGFQSTLVYYDPDTNELREPTAGGGLPFNPATYDWNFHVEQTDGTSYEYDSNTGALLNQSDRIGNTITYSDDGDRMEARDNAGTLLSKVQITRSGGRVDNIRATWTNGAATNTDQVSYTYNANGDLETFTDLSGAVTRYSYNQLFTVGSDGTVNLSPTPLGRPHFLTRITDVAQNLPTLTATFDADGRLAGLVDASGASASVTYSFSGTNPNLAAGQTSTISVDAMKFTTEVIRDGSGNIVRRIQQTGTDSYVVMVYKFDADHNQTAESKPHQVSGTARYSWQPDASSWQTQTVYGDPNNKDLPTVVTDGDGKTTTYTYDEHGNVTSVVDPLGQTTTNVYDPKTGELRQTVDANGTTSNYAYDTRGNLTGVVQLDANGKSVSVVSTHFNALNLMDSFTNAAGQTTNVGYDLRGRQTSISYVGTDGVTPISDQTDYDDLDRITATRHYVGGSLVSSMSMSYTASGRIVSTADAFGNVSITRYDARGNIVETRTPARDASGTTVTMIIRKAYDANGRLIAQTDPYIERATNAADFRVTQTFYDGAGREVMTRRLAGVGIDLAYVSGGTGADHLGGIFRSTFNYDAASDTYDNVAAASVTLSTESTHYDDQGRVDAATSPTGLVTHYGYDDAGRQNQTWYDIVLNGSTTTRVKTTSLFDSAGQQTRTIDAAGRVTDYFYDANGNMTDMIVRGVVANGVTPGSSGDNTADDMVTRTIYDDLGHEIATIDALGRRTDNEYDAAGRLIAVTLPAISASDARRPRYEYHYDAFGHKTYAVTNVYLDPGTNQVVYVTKDANGNATLTSRSAAATPDTWPTDKGNVTAYTYDAQGRQLTRRLPAGEVETTVYDQSSGPANGQVIYSVDSAGRVTAYDYDDTPLGGGRTTGVRYYGSVAAYNNGSGTPARTVTSTFDAFGRVVRVVDTASATPTTYAYDVEGRLIKLASAQGTIHYAYDVLGRKVATWTGSGETLAAARASATTLTEYGYDALDRLVTTTATRRFGQTVDVNAGLAGVQPEVTTTIFGADGRVDYELSTTAAGTVTTDDVYDAQGRVASVTHFADADGDHAFDAGETLLAGFAYTYNVDGTRRGEADADGQGHATTVGWTYDGEGRLAGETFDGFDDAGAALAYTDAFTYDVSGNKVGLTHDDRTAGGAGSAGADFASADRYDADDRLVSEVKNSVDNAQDSYTAYGYAGTDQTSQTVHSGLTSGGAVTQTTTYGYDATGAMTSATVAIAGGTTTTATYRYDAGGIRVERTQGGQTTVYLVDPSNMTGYAQVLEEGVDANGDGRLDASEVQRAYTLGMTVLAQATATQVVRLLADAHGSTRAALNAGATTLNAAAVLQRYVYSAYGSDLGLSSTPLTAVRYAGQMIDALTGLSYNRARWYSAATGRFTQLDTYGGDSANPITQNHYLYGNGDPIGMTDPTGHFSLGELLVTIGIDNIVSRAQNAYQAGKVTAKVAKTIVRLALIECGIFVFTNEDLSNEQKAMLLLYYGYEEAVFEKTYKTEVRGLTLAAKVDKVVKYIASLAESAGRDTGDLPTLGLDFLPDSAKASSKHLTAIPYTGSRNKDYVLARFAAVAEDAADVILNLVQTGVSSERDWLDEIYKAARQEIVGNGKFFGRIWHHSELLGVMETIQRQVHEDNRHTGGVALWEVINDKDYI